MNDIRERIEELKTWKDGWLDGQGKVPPSGSMDWIPDAFDQWYSADLPTPYVFLSPEGLVICEWSELPNARMFIDPAMKIGGYEGCDDEDFAVWLPLLVSRGWEALAMLIQYDLKSSDNVNTQVNK